MPPFWKTRTLASYLLWPLGQAYAGAAALHGWMRAQNPYYAGVPVISIGNLTVGGTGKTPLTQWLAAELSQQGYQVAIVSRGYKGTAGVWPTRVDPSTHTAAEVGDEPLMLAQNLQHQGVQVWVARHRPGGVIRAEQAGATLILLDDGFQRRDVARNVDIVVLDGQAPFGNGFPIPAGPLREGASALTRATFAVMVNPQGPVQQVYPGLLTYRLHTRTNVPTPLAPGYVAFAGIGNPLKFKKGLEEAGATVCTFIPYPDHHPYTPANLAYLKNLALSSGLPLLTTAKDAARLPPDFAQTAPLTLTGDDLPNILAHIAKHLQ